MNETINVNLIPSKVGNVLNFSQYDVGRISKISLQNGDETYTIPTGAAVTIEATKPSGFGFSEACTFSGNEVTVTTTATMTLEAGRFPAELVITNGGVVIGTANFIMNVEESPHPTGTPDGDKEEILNEIQLYVTNLVESATEQMEQELLSLAHANANTYGTVKVDHNSDPPAGYIKLTYGNDRDIYAPYLSSASDTIRSKFLPDATTSSKGAVKVDNAMSDDSTNPVQNNVVKAYVDAHTGTISATSDGAGTVTIEMI